MKQKHTFRRVLSVVLAAVLLLPLAGPMTVMEVDAGKVTQAQINALKGEASDIAAQKKDIQNQLKAVRADKSKALEQKELLEAEIDLIQAEIDNINAQIDSYNQLIEAKNAEVADTQAREQAQYELFCKRIRQMEEEGEQSYWSILFSSQSFSDLLDNYIMIEEIIEYDNGVMESLAALRAILEAVRAELEEAKAGEEAARALQEASKAELDAQEAEVDNLIADIKKDENTLKAMEADLKKAAEAMDAEIKRLEREYANQIASVPSESGFLWPLPASINTLSSLYGGRKHPVTGKADNHGGIDIPAAKNTKIYAAKSGVVTTSIKQGSYGNYVVVSHSDGTSTLYAHMNSRAVSKGETVKQGQVIGYVGTTGRSTGNHLHFEIRVNGDRRDPVDYFKDKTLYVSSNGRKVLLPH